MKVVMQSQISGYRYDAGTDTYSDWPGRGQEVELDNATAVSMLKSGQASPVGGGSVEEAIRNIEVEDATGIPVSLDSVPGPVDETAPEGVLVPKPNGDLREISSTERLAPGDHDVADPTTVDETSGPVIHPDPTSPSGSPATAKVSSGLKAKRPGAANKTAQGNPPVAEAK